MPAEQPPGDQAEGPTAPRHHKQLHWLERPHELRVARIVGKGPQARAGEGVDSSHHGSAGGAQGGSRLLGASGDGPH